MLPEQFHPRQFECGKKHAIELELGPLAKGINLPVLLVRGIRSGKTLVVTGAIHGDEYEGPQTIFDAYHALDPQEMRGDFLSVPVSNPPAFWNGTRTSPLDGANLARVFPGDLHTSPSSIIAHHLAHSIIARADFYLDIHSAGIRWMMPTLVGYNANDPRSREAAWAFGTPVIWGHPVIAPGRTVSFATDRNIPWLYTEARGGGRVDPTDLRLFREGVFNLLSYLEILPGQPSKAEVKWHLFGDGNTDQGLASSHRGFCVSTVEAMQAVHQGEELGRVYNLLGETLQTFRAPCDGIVAMVRKYPIVEPGEPLFLITGLMT